MGVLSDQLPGWFKRKGQAHADDEGAQEAGTMGNTTASTTTGGGSSQEPVVVWEAANQMEAEVVKGRLVSEGIPAFVRSEALGAIYGLTAGGLARADVLVPAPLAEQALAILAPDEEGDEGFADTEAGDVHDA